MIRSAVTDFVGLGVLPDESAPEETISHHQELLSRIKAPVTASGTATRSADAGGLGNSSVDGGAGG